MVLCALIVVRTALTLLCRSHESSTFCSPSLTQSLCFMTLKYNRGIPNRPQPSTCTGWLPLTSAWRANEV
jgi:hypothetical protein